MKEKTNKAYERKCYDFDSFKMVHTELNLLITKNTSETPHTKKKKKKKKKKVSSSSSSLLLLLLKTVSWLFSFYCCIVRIVTIISLIPTHALFYTL